MKSQELTLPRHGFIREAKLIKFLPFSRATLWRKTKEREFPAPVRIFSNITCWKCEDVWGWLDSHSKPE